MTRKDYKLIAQAIQELPWAPTLAQVSAKLAEKLKADNPNFDVERFMRLALKGV